MRRRCQCRVDGCGLRVDFARAWLLGERRAPSAAQRADELGVTHRLAALLGQLALGVLQIHLRDRAARAARRDVRIELGVLDRLLPRHLRPCCVRLRLLRLTL